MSAITETEPGGRLLQFQDEVQAEAQTRQWRQLLKEEGGAVLEAVCEWDWPRRKGLGEAVAEMLGYLECHTHRMEYTERLGADDVRAFLLFFIQEKRVSWSYKTLPSGRKVTGQPAGYHAPSVWAVFVYSKLSYASAPERTLPSGLNSMTSPAMKSETRVWAVLMYS